MRSSNLEYSEKLDHLRLAACLMVLVFHVTHPFYTWFSGLDSYKPLPNPLSVFIIDGHTGVALFLVLSGFLFARICRKGTFNVKNFYLNRFLRIYPLYIFILLVAIYFGKPGEAMWPFIYAMLMQANTVNVDGLQHLWTIAVELQFYLLFPLLLWLYRCRHGLSLLVLCMFFVILTMATMYTSTGEFFSLAYGNIWGRVNQCIAGMIAGFTLERYQDRLRHPAVFPLMLFGYSLVLMLFHSQGGTVSGSHHPMWIFFPTVEGMCWSAIIAAYLSTNWSLPAGLSKVLAYGGTLSYSLYVWHLFVVLTMYRFAVPLLKTPRKDITWFSNLQSIAIAHPFETTMLFTFLVVFPITLFVSIITYHCIEMPFFNLRRRYIFQEGEAQSKASARFSPTAFFVKVFAPWKGPLKVAGIAAAAVIVVAFAGEAYCYASGTDTSAIFLPDEKLGFRLMPCKRLEWHVDGYSNDLISTAGFRDVEHIEKKAPGVKRILMLGDSFSEGLQVPLEKIAARRLEHKLNASGGTSYEVINASCSSYSLGQCALLYDQLAAKYQPDEVVLVYGSGAAGTTYRSAPDFSCLGRPYFYIKDNQLQQDSSLLPPKAYCMVMRTLYENSRFARWLSYQCEISKETDKSFRLLHDSFVICWRMTFCRKMNYANPDGAQVSSAVLSYLNKVIKMRGAHFTVCALPSLTPEERIALKEVKLLAFQQDFSFSSLKSALSRVGSADYLKHHLSAAGHDGAAQTLSDFLQNRQSGISEADGNSKISSGSLPL